MLVFSDRVYAAPADVAPGEVGVRYAPEDRLRLAGTPYLWVERVGRGRVIASADEPSSRDQWRGLLLLFASAVFLGGI